MLISAHVQVHARGIIWKAITGPWEQTAGPFGGTVRSIAIPAEGTIFAGTENGVFRSTDQGATWQEVNMGLTRPFVSAVIVTKQVNILAATDGSLFRSTDHGDTWKEVYQAYASSTGFALGVDDHIYLATANGVHRSINDGTAWALAGLQGKLVMSILARVEDGVEVVYASTQQHGIFRSADGCISWQPAGLVGMQIPSLASRPDGLLAAGTEYGVYVSNDAGQTWSRTPMPQNYLYVYALAFGAGGALLAGESGGIYRSTDDGQTWTKHDFVESTVLALTINAEGHIFAGTGTKGIFRSTDQGQSWEEINRGLTNTTITGFALTPDGTFYAAARGAGVFRSTDNGATWDEFRNGLSNPFVLSLAVDASGSVYAGVEGDPVYRLDAGANTWILTNSPRSRFPKALITGADGALYFGAGQYAYRSKDRGESWTRFGNGDLPVVYTLVVEANGSAFAGTNDGVYHLAGENATWSPSGLTDVLVQALLYDARTAYAGGYNAGLYRTLDNGAGWSRVALEGATVSSLTAGPNGDLFAGTFYDGVYASSDGVNWRAYNTGLETERPILALAFDGNAYLFAGTEGNGIFRSTVPVRGLSTSVAAETPSVPARFSLAQNYPNPFNASTVIRFEIPASLAHADARLAIYNLRGELVRELLNKKMSAGNHQVRWDGRNQAGSEVASGIYLYRLQVVDPARGGTGHVTEMRKLSLLK